MSLEVLSPIRLSSAAVERGRVRPASDCAGRACGVWRATGEGPCEGQGRVPRGTVHHPVRSGEWEAQRSRLFHVVQ